MSPVVTLDSTNNLVSINDVRRHLGIDVGEAQVVTAACSNENAGGGLGGKYWLISSEDDYYVWYDVDNGSADPAVTARTGIEVNISDGDSAATVATATQVAVNAVDGMTATVSGSVVTVTGDSAGEVTAPDNGTTTFNVTVSVQGTSGNSAHDNVISMLINGVSWYFNEMTYRKLKAQSLTEYYDGPGGYLLYLNSPPIASLTLYQDSDRAWGVATAISSDDYALYTDTGKIVLTGTAFLHDARVIKATYTGGFSTIPYDIQEAALELIAQRFHTQTTKSDNKTSYSNNGGSISIDHEIQPLVARVLDRYRRVGAALG